MPPINPSILICLVPVLSSLLSPTGKTQQLENDTASVTGVSGHRGDYQQLPSVSPLAVNGLAGAVISCCGLEGVRNSRRRVRFIDQVRSPVTSRRARVRRRSRGIDVQAANHSSRGPSFSR